MHDPNNPDWDICPGETLQERLDDTERYIEELRLHFGLHLASVETNEPEEHHPNKETADALN
jgi:hypothetical protein